jgi:hypothetical protein
MPLWTPAEINTDLWLDASDSESITIGTGVSEWVDKSGKLRHASQATPSLQPVVFSGVLNGLDIISFDGAGDFLGLPTGFLDGTTEFTLFMVRSGIEEDNKALFGPVDSYAQGLVLHNAPTTKIQAVRANWTTSGDFERITAANNTLWSSDGNAAVTAVTGNTTATVARKNGALITTGLGITPLEYTGIYAVGQYYSSVNSSDQELAEFIIVKAVLSDSEIQRVEGYLAWKWGLEASLPVGHPYEAAAPITSGILRAVLEQHYDLLALKLRMILEQEYHLTSRFAAELIQVYGLRMLVALVQRYGNAPRYRAELAQHYGDCGLLRRIVTQSYGDAARYRSMFDQDWNMQEGLRQSFVQRYSISAASYRSLCDQQYDLAELDLLRAQLDQLYVLAAGEALVQRMDQSVVCCGVTHTSAYNIFLEQDESLFYMVGELQIADELEYLQYVAYETEVVITVDGESYSFIVDGYPRKSRAPGNSTFVVPLASPTILLQGPHSKVETEEFVGMASVLVAGLAAPYAVDWRLVDWFIPAGVLTGTGESAISIIKKIVVAAGGLVQTSPAGVLICRPEYPVSVNEWSTATPDIELTDQDDFFQIDPSPSLRDGYNVFYLSNQTLAGDTVKMDVKKLSSSRAQIDVYQQPWDETVRFNMDHSGGWWVSVIAEGVTIEEVTEQVEIIGGSGQTSKPVMSYFDHEYSETDLGAVTVDEAGNVTTEILENSLLQLTYKKRYWRFLATDMNNEEVQFFPEEVAA